MTRETTANIDFAKSPSQHRRYLNHLADTSDILFIQEAKRIRLRDLLPANWYTNQRVRTQSTRGSALCWRAGTFDYPPKSRMKMGALPVGIDHGKPRVAKMLPRRIIVTKVILNGKKVALIVCHYPPLRYEWLWPQMDRRLARIVRQCVKEGYAVRIGADFNQNPHAVAAALNWRLGNGVRLRALSDGKIDGFLLPANTKIASRGADTYGKDNGLTDHPSYTIEVDQ